MRKDTSEQYDVRKLPGGKIPAMSAMFRLQSNGEIEFSTPLGTRIITPGTPYEELLAVLKEICPESPTTGKPEV